MKNWLKNHIFEIILVLIVGLIFVTNYQPGTYLLGWDNLQTELNPGLGVKRALLSVWQEYQSMGLMAGMAHASDLTRSIFIWIISLFLPQNLVRYFFQLSMLLVGGLGMFKLLAYSGFGHSKRLFAFIGAVFYMLNIGIVQLFAVPFEPFTVFFAGLPFEIWIFFKTLQNPSKKNILLLVLINLLATPQAYIQTLFIVYCLVLGFLTLGRLIQTKDFALIKRGVVLFLIIFAVNAFWILPQAYFLKTSGNLIKEAKINQLANDDHFYENQEKGRIKYFLRLEGFYYDLFQTDQKPLFAEWKNYYQGPVVALPYVLAAIFLLGMFNKKRYQLPFILAYVLVAVALLMDTPGFRELGHLLRQNGLVNQMFRSPFTKFVVPLALISSYFLAAGAELIFNQLRKFKFKISANNFGLIIAILILFYSLPAFGGYFFAPSMKVSIPKDYFDVMDYFKTADKNARIALLPEYTFWGWFFNRWGYNGSGFIWYGIEQPIISRTFDTWSENSESYYWELKDAQERESLEDFEKVLEKYSVDYLLLDKSLLPVTAMQKTLQYDRIESLLRRSEKVNLVKNSENLSLYRVRRDKTVKDFVSVADYLPNVGPNSKIIGHDSAYFELADYRTDQSQPYDAYYPFLDLLTDTDISDKNWQIEEKGENFIFKARLDFDPSGYGLSTISSGEKIRIYEEEVKEEYPRIAAAQINAGFLEVAIPKRLLATVNFTEKHQNCGYKGTFEDVREGSSIVTKAQSRAIACFGQSLPSFDQKFSYLVKVKSQNLEGKSLFLFILDNTKKQSIVEDRLTKEIEYYVIPPKYQYGLGYTVNLQNYSYENLTSINKLEPVEVYVIPYESISNLAFLKDLNRQNTNFKNNFVVDKKNYYQYEIDTSGKGYLILNQSFHPGWNATIDGQELDHFPISNWANGWRIDSQEPVKVKIFFWPQYLQFLGFGLLVLAFIAPILYHKIYSRHRLRV